MLTQQQPSEDFVIPEGQDDTVEAVPLNSFASVDSDIGVSRLELDVEFETEVSLVHLPTCSVYPVLQAIHCDASLGEQVAQLPTVQLFGVVISDPTTRGDVSDTTNSVVGSVVRVTASASVQDSIVDVATANIIAIFFMVFSSLSKKITFIIVSIRGGGGGSQGFPVLFLGKNRSGIITAQRKKVFSLHI